LSPSEQAHSPASAVQAEISTVFIVLVIPSCLKTLKSGQRYEKKGISPNNQIKKFAGIKLFP